MDLLDLDRSWPCFDKMKATESAMMYEMSDDLLSA
jgi:hypothetical protein